MAEHKPTLCVVTSLNAKDYFQSIEQEKHKQISDAEDP